MEGAMLYRKFPAYNSNVSSAIPSDNLVRSMRSFTIPITTNFGLFSQMLKVTLETFLMRRAASAKPQILANGEICDLAEIALSAHVASATTTVSIDTISSQRLI